MNSWQRKRKEGLAELNLGAHVLAYLLAVIVFIASEPGKEYSFSFFTALLIGFIAPAVIFITLDYFFQQSRNSQKAILAWNITKHAVLFAMLTAVFSTQRGDSPWLLSALYLLPVVLSCITLGRLGGIAFAGAATGSIIFLHSLPAGFNAENQSIEAVLVLGGVFFLLAWFLGGIIEIEKDTTAHLVTLANEDSLTGLGNHRFFHEQLNRFVEESVNEHLPLSLILLDIDCFKLFNDTYGHTQGDMLLQEMAGLFRGHAPQGAVVARYSGDDFAVILPGTTLQEAGAIAQILLQAVSNHDFSEKINQACKKITVSAGVANYPYHVQKAQDLFEAADKALYSSKSTGCNTVRAYHAIIERLSRTAEESEKELINSLRTLMSVVNGRDRYTYGHSERVSYYAKLVGKRMGISAQDLRLLEFGAFLHDLGKIEIPRDVLNKNGPLSEYEWEIICQHPKWGAEILKPISLLQPVIPMVLYHHENFNGSGYPEGLSGKKIPLFARILRVVDSYDAITSSRPYRNLLSREDAVKEIFRYRGIHYDPLIIDLFVSCIEGQEDDVFCASEQAN